MTLDKLSKSPNNTSISGTEIVIGIVAPVGTELENLRVILSSELQKFTYTSKIIKISSDVIQKLSKAKFGTTFSGSDEYRRISQYMDEGDKLREFCKNNEILALGAVSKIKRGRTKKETPEFNTAYIIDSLKTPEEVKRLRQIYSNGFYLIGVYSDEQTRLNYLTDHKNISDKNANLLIRRDEDEQNIFGQHTRNTFHLSDFFVHWDNNIEKLRNQIKRVTELIFGNPFITPTFDEYAMYMAFSSALRSGDLSRQVGAIIAKNNTILATGANEVPKALGGQYFPIYDPSTGKVEDNPLGRDFTRKSDSNSIEKQEIIKEILNLLPKKISPEEKAILQERLAKGKIGDITEYGRIVHAEMDALCACARVGINTAEATLYSTTFPCHNCAKHLISAGIKRVVYVEPYPKSKAPKFHDDSIDLGLGDKESGKVNFEPFVGVGPRNFLNLFSLELGLGLPLVRKDEKGKIVEWKASESTPRIRMQPTSYLRREVIGVSLLEELFEIENEV